MQEETALQHKIKPVVLTATLLCANDSVREEWIRTHGRCQLCGDEGKPLTDGLCRDCFGWAIPGPTGEEIDALFEEAKKR
jgi:ribosomal protein S14